MRRIIGGRRVASGKGRIARGLEQMNQMLSSLESFAAKCTEIHSLGHDAASDADALALVPQLIVEPLLELMRGDSPWRAARMLLGVDAGYVADEARAMLAIRWEIEDAGTVDGIELEDGVVELLLEAVERLISKYADGELVAGSDDDGEQGADVDDGYSRLVRSCFRDVEKLRRVGLEGARAEWSGIIVNNGWLRSVGKLWAWAGYQSGVVDGAKKNMASGRQANVWLSRYLMAGAIELAREGFTAPLESVVTMDDADIAAEGVKLVGECGWKLELADDAAVRKFAASVREKVRGFCLAKTGWSEPETVCWLIGSEN